MVANELFYIFAKHCIKHLGLFKDYKNDMHMHGSIKHKTYNAFKYCFKPNKKSKKMKKKTFFYGLVLGAISLFASCGDEDVLSNSSESNHDGLLNNEAIVQEAISFASSLDENTTRSSSAISAKGVQKVNLDFVGDTRADNATDIPDFYSVGLNDGKGTVILVEKDNAIRPIAYFQNENDVNINDALVDSTSTFSFIVKALLGENIDFKASDVAPTTRAVTNTIVERLEPKCKVYWDQEAPYNKYCFTKDGKQALAGCVAIAGAQALTVLRPYEPLISSWDAVTARSTLNSGTREAEEVAKLIANIGANIGMNYGVEESGAKKSNLISYFKKKYGVEDYDCERAIEVLKTKHGVIVIRGSASTYTHGWWFWEKTHYEDGHAFIADGYVKYGNNGKVNDDPYYLHINYGWGGSNGYILSAQKNYREDTYYKKYPYKLTYATLTYPYEKNWR